MSRSPRISGADLVEALGKAGFRVLRVKGSHHFLRHQDGRSTEARRSAQAYFTRFFEIVI